MPALKTSLSLLALLFLISAAPSLLFSQYTTATLSGIIADLDGRTVPEARLTIENTGTGFVRTYTTGDDGAYLFPSPATARTCKPLLLTTASKNATHNKTSPKSQPPSIFLRS